MVKHQLDNERIVNSFLEQRNNPRYERKFRSNISSDIFIEGYLNQLGFFTEHPPRIVKSIYFDTSNFQFANDNINGVRYRIKPRVRWYQDIFTHVTSDSSLEYKIKDGFLGYKFSKKLF